MTPERAGWPRRAYATVGRSWLVGLAIFAAVGCQSTMSVEEARKVTASFQGRAFVPPPRTITDVTAVLDQQKRDNPEAVVKARVLADTRPPETQRPATLAEAISGLGRAFFYAGARALLVSNWPVETTSARALTTELFRRQSGDAALSRAQALRQTVTWLMDGRGYVDPRTNKVAFSYAHPIFWAPFSVVGDGGR